MQRHFIKQCKSKRAFLNELFVYQSDIPDKPELIEVIKPDTLVLERVDGIPYLDADSLTDTMISKLAQTVSRFHNITRLEEKVLCHWDNQPRNILWYDKKQRFVLLDFEDIRLAPPEADLTHLFLFWAEMMSHDIFSTSVKTFIKAYQKTRQLSAAMWHTEARKARQRFDSRRRRYNKLEKTENPDRRKNRRLIIDLQLS